MSWWVGWLLTMAFASLLIASPVVAYLTVKMSAYAWHRGKDIYLESRRPKE